MTKEQLEDCLISNDTIYDLIKSTIEELTDDEDFVFTIKVSKLSEE